MAKINKGKKTYTYQGTPKSYWHFVERKASQYMHDQKQDPEARKKALERIKDLDQRFDEIKKRRKSNHSSSPLREKQRS